MSMYQLRVTANTKDRRLISYRKTSCWCSKCIVRDYDACLVFNALDGGENTTWTTVDLQAEEQHLSSTPLLPAFDIVDATSSSASSFFNSNAETDSIISHSLYSIFFTLNLAAFSKSNQVLALT